MASEAAQQFSILQVPHLDRLIATPTDQSLSIRTDGYTVNDVCMVSKSVQHFSAVQVPHLDRLIITPTDQRLPVGADGDRFYRA